MKNIILLLVCANFLFLSMTHAQTVEVLPTFGANAEIQMTANPAGGNNILSMLGTNEFDKSLWRLIYEKNDLTPPDGPIEFAWEVGLGAGFSVDPQFFSIGRYDFNLDFIFSRAGFVMDNQTLFTGIGEITPDARLHVYNLDDFGATKIPATLIGQHQGNVAYGYLTVDQPSTDDNDNIARFRDNGATKVWIQRTASTYQLTVFGDALASGGVWINSDRKLKKEIQEMSSSLNAIKKLKPSKYYFKRDSEANSHLPEEEQFGLVAQDLQRVFPNLVRESDEKNEAGEVIGRIQSVNYIGLIPVLIEAVQELDAGLASKSDEVATLKSENESLRSRLEKLEKAVAKLMEN